MNFSQKILCGLSVVLAANTAMAEVAPGVAPLIYIYYQIPQAKYIDAAPQFVDPNKKTFVNCGGGGAAILGYAGITGPTITMSPVQPPVSNAPSLIWQLPSSQYATCLPASADAIKGATYSFVYPTASYSAGFQYSASGLTGTSFQVYDNATNAYYNYAFSTCNVFQDDKTLIACSFTLQSN